ncbi:unnamed protein product [Ranitomeya imitator]|uniref:Uncharacterized protein n=1 Tax=Ranitomeya imitator TaxID=111125 RepID=A0ABN9LVP0_9NEOB|nr:unnamed protein product [Ranitomeya imitator]
MDLILLTVDYLHKEIPLIENEISSIESQLRNTLSQDQFNKIKTQTDKTIAEFQSQLQERKRLKFIRDTDHYQRGEVYRWTNRNMETTERRPSRCWNSSYSSGSESDGSRSSFRSYQGRGRNSRSRGNRQNPPGTEPSSTRMQTRSQQYCPPWKRYIDDIFLVWCGDLDSLQSFHQSINTYVDKLTFSILYDQKSISFLDTLAITAVTIGDGLLFFLFLDLELGVLFRAHIKMMSSIYLCQQCTWSAVEGPSWWKIDLSKKQTIIDMYVVSTGFFLAERSFSSGRYSSRFTVDIDNLISFLHHLHKVFCFCPWVDMHVGPKHLHLWDTEPISFLSGKMAGHCHLVCTCV